MSFVVFVRTWSHSTRACKVLAQQSHAREVSSDACGACAAPP
jgi:hypothetical protein